MSDHSINMEHFAARQQKGHHADDERLELRLEEAERQRAELEFIYENAPVGFAIVDPVDLRYVSVNDLHAQVLGVPKEQILGRRARDIATLPGVEERLRRVAAGETIRGVLVEGELRSRPGEHLSWNVSYSPIKNAEGRVVAIVVVAQDITHQKRSEAALIQTEKLAAVGLLASSISHEINNPLESVMNLLYLIGGSDELPRSLRGYVETALGELSRVGQIVTQTLRFHRQSANATWITASELIGPVLDLYHGRLTNSHIQVETSYNSASPVLCFESDIRQILNNLTANAIDAMRQGGRLLVRTHDTVDRTHGGANRPGLRITIADTGLGIAPQIRMRIFEPFFTTKDINGTGLGLWISSGIVDRHQGRLTMRSCTDAVHHGTVFSLFIPRKEEPALLR